jgi:hypothetical protein
MWLSRSGNLMCLLHTLEENIMIEAIQTIITTIFEAIVSVFNAIIGSIQGPQA